MWDFSIKFVCFWPSHRVGAPLLADERLPALAVGSAVALAQHTRLEAAPGGGGDGVLEPSQNSLEIRLLLKLRYGLVVSISENGNICR